MSKINFGRAILGGLVAGVVLNIGEYLLNEVVFKQQMEEMFRKLHVTPPGGNFIAVAVAITFLLGILLVLLYAMIRPRYGPGPKTAICAASVIWFCVYFYCGVLNAALFGLTTSFVIIGMVWGIIEYSLAAIAGAWLYRE
ncbi:MAG TPA: hypothetical protein VJ749_12145 [Pyrinomonadaceae bacterium]|jgi:hypothetical protein|nr:hypothetical protein [Pyrinomonadaceae bacterium]